MRETRINQNIGISEQNLGRLRMRWWIVKVVCGTTLIAALIIKTLHVLPSYWYCSLAVAQFLALLGFLIVIFHYFVLKKQNKNIEVPSELITQHGLYRWVRHPMYLADYLWFTGVFLLFANPFSLVVLLIAYVALFLQAKEEDRYLNYVFGDRFLAWKGNTRLILPWIY